MPERLSQQDYSNRGLLSEIIRFCLNNRLVVMLCVMGLLLGGVLVAPFDWQIDWLPRYPISVDAIPDIGENQQIVFTDWPGRSPQDIEDQVTYPLTANLLGLAGVKTVRSTSMFGFSSIYVIFEDRVPFDLTRQKILERLNSLPEGMLPEGATPRLGPDATALGQVFWYTLEGRDPQGKPTGGWDLHELRTIQDWTVRYALQAASGIAEVASVGGFVREYQIDVDPDAMYAAKVSLNDVFMAVMASNRDVGARTIEINRVDYLVRGLGFIKSVEDIEQIVVKTVDAVPIHIRDIAHVGIGPALRTGVLDKGGAEAVGGVAVVRYGENPLAAIKNVKAKITEIAPSLPQKTLPDGTVSQVTIVPFYDRTGLIYETLGTLNAAIYEQIIITAIVIILLLRNFRSSLIISALMPMAVLITFVGMKLLGIDANIVALSGIVIAIGEISDMGIVICENIVQHLERDPRRNRLHLVFDASREVASAVLTAISTTVISFLPVFAMTGAEGKLFKPLAYTKTVALTSSVFLAVLVVPPLAYYFFRKGSAAALAHTPDKKPRRTWLDYVLIAILLVLLTDDWMPIGPDNGMLLNLLWVVVIVAVLIGSFVLIIRFYESILGWCLRHKLLFLSLPTAMIIGGGFVWANLGREFMPSLDEGSFLYMPTTMPHASIAEATDQLSKIDAAIASIPEIDTVVGKIGRVESALDPAPLSMFETVINYKPKYKTDKNGRLVLDDQGKAIRQWRDGLETPHDLWNEIVRIAQLPGTTSAPLLQPIETRIVMLQTGMRAPMGIKVKGPSLEAIQQAGLDLEAVLKQVSMVEPAAVFADRIVAQPYLELRIDRQAIARYGLRVDDVQKVIEIAIGGTPITTTVEGRQRYPVRVRYLRELRDQVEALNQILVPAMDGSAQIPLGQLVQMEYKPGPQMIKSEDTFLTSYVLFDKKPGYAEVDVVMACKQTLEQKIKDGSLTLPEGVSYTFSGTWENQVHAQKTLMLVIPVVLVIIFILLYLQFESFGWSCVVFTTVLTAWSGGFVWLWFYNQDWFMNFTLFGINFRDLFNIHPYNLSVAVWVGFLAVFGIASDDGVLMMTYLKDRFATEKPVTIEHIRRETIFAASRRVRPALMTSATTILALLPVLTSIGRGSDIMVPMAIPSFGGMTLSMVDLLIVPTLFCMVKEFVAKRSARSSQGAA
ncbi:MAG TPA: efflux RND transporter permease subunit [Anaerohalosphaeraceae bacterium]|nr:efflux RND transporter permease subunit [Anaerohalosphaeraceae bacterium]